MPDGIRHVPRVVDVNPEVDNGLEDVDVVPMGR